MSRLIKSGAAALAPDPVVPFAVAPQPVLDGAAEREAELEARILDLEQKIAAAEESRAKELETTREEAARDALEERSDAEERALKALSEAAAEANRAWKEHLEALEAGSIAIARAVLEKVFVDPAERSALLTSSIARRMQRLESEAIVRVRVSTKDFAEESVRAASAALGESAMLEPDPVLSSGECIIDLKLGQVDLGLDSQWRRIDETLTLVEREASRC